MPTEATDTKFEILPPRPDRRRGLAAVRRQAGYDKSGFDDRSRYAGTMLKQRVNLDGTPHPLPFTPDELHTRAVTRRDRTTAMVVALGRMKIISTHELERRLDTRAPHANRSTAERLHRDRRPAKLRSQAAFLRGAINNLRGLHANGKAMPWFYMHSSARPAEAPTVELQMAA